MPKLHNGVPKYRKHKQSGQAIVTLNGRDYLLGPHNTQASKTKYDRLIAEWLASDRRIPIAETTALPLVELVGRYWAFAKRRYQKNGKPTAMISHIKSASRYLMKHYRTLPASEFGPLQLKVVRQAMVDDSDWSRAYINSQVGVLVRLFKWSVTEGLLPAATHAALALVEGLRPGEVEVRETAKVKPVAVATIEATLPHLPQVVADMVKMQQLTAMRPAEVCIMRPCDVDRTGEIWLYQPMRHKTEHRGIERTILIGPKAQEILLRYLARDAESYCFSPQDSEAKRRAAQHANRSTPLSYGNRPGTNRKRKPQWRAGSCYDSNSYRHAIHRACDRAFPHPEHGSKIRDVMTEVQIEELKKWQSQHRWSPNQLRHTAATLIRKEFGLEAAQVILGHTAADVTQVYAERDLAKGLSVAKLIG
jgi:integrase